jgi:hypothetical protein
MSSDVQIIYTKDYITGSDFLKSFFNKYRVHLDMNVVLETAKILSIKIILLDDKVLIPQEKKLQLMERIWKNIKTKTEVLKK